MLTKLRIATLKEIVGVDNVHTSAHEKIIASTPYREGQGHADFLAIVDPANVDEISQIVKYCLRENIAIIMQGGLTSLTKASIPTPRYIEDRQQIILRTYRMNKMLEVIPNDFGIIKAVRTEPGITLHALNEKLQQFDVKVPIGLGIGFKAQMGGIVSTNAGGTEAAFKGRPDKLVQELEIVTADGTISKVSSQSHLSLKLSNFIGQEGTTGIITNILISVIPLPIQRKVVLVEIDTIEKMHALLKMLKEQFASNLNAFERIDANVLRLMCHYYDKPDPFANRRAIGKKSTKYNILIELDSCDMNVDLTSTLRHVLTEAKNADYIQAAWISSTDEEANEIWSYRLVKLSESIKKRANEINGQTIAFDIGLPEGDHAPFPSLALEEKLQTLIPGIEFYGFGHAAGGGQGGTLLHFDPIVPKGIHDTQIRMLKDAVYDEISMRQGSIAAEHGIGFYKRDDFKKYDKKAYAKRVSLKARLDPKNILNPGKVVFAQDIQEYLNSIEK